MKSWLLFLGMIWSLTSVLSAQDKPFPDTVPTKLVMQIGGGLDGRNFVTLENGVLSFQFKQMGKVVPEKSFNTKPDKAAWARFIKEINAAKLYRWSENYPDPGVFDGTQWSIDLEIDGRKFHSEGNNNYPTDGNESKPTNSAEYTPPFNRMCEAVSHLIGRKFE